MNKCYYYNNAGAGPFVVTEQSTTALVGLEGRTTVGDPNWRVKVSEKQNASNPYFVRSADSRNAILHGDWYNSLGSHIFQQISWSHAQSFVHKDTDTILRDLALKKLKRAFLSQREQVKVIAPLVEARELRGLVTKSLFFLVDVVKALIACKRKKDPVVVLKEASAIWLTAMFGIAPMLRDIDQAGKALSDLVNVDNSYAVRLSKRKRKEWTDQQSFRINGYGIEGVKFILNANCALQYRFTAGFDVNILAAESYNKDIQRTFGLTWGDLLPAVWELTPYSWVVDYLATVGPWLEDLFFDDGGSFIYGSESRRYSAEGTITPVLDTASQRQTTTLVKVGSFSTQIYERKVLTSLPRAALRIKSTDEIGKYAASKLTNLCAILIGGLGKPDRRRPSYI
jgi:hypothetical protein